MFRTGYVLLLAGVMVLAGCTELTDRPASEQSFGAVSFRIHPTFTQIKNWTSGAKPDGIEAVIEFQDEFGDPTRAMGTVRFELYRFESDYADHRGPRLAIWSASLNSHEDQVARWDPVARGYTFQLTFANISTDRGYVLTAQVDRSNSRLFDQLVIEGSGKEGFHGDRRTQRAPTDAPGHGVE
jgi:hypothetical protein